MPPPPPPLDINTADGIWNIYGWINVSCMIGIIGLFSAWNPRWYSYLRRHALLPHQNVIFVAFILFVGAEGWGGWHYWLKNDWSVGITCPIVYLIMLILLASYFIFLMISPMVYIPMLVSVGAFGLSIAYTVLAFKENDWSGAMGVVAIIVSVVEFLLCLQIWMSHVNLYEDYDDKKEAATKEFENRKPPKPFSYKSLMGKSNKSTDVDTEVGDMNNNGITGDVNIDVPPSPSSSVPPQTSIQYQFNA